MPGAGSGACGPSSIRTIVAATLGNALEFFDFIAYGFFATSIAHAFFPSRNPATGLLLALATFGASFGARPIGAAVLGAYADRRGRRPAMLLAVGLMSAASLVLAVVPPFAAIGVAAPLLVLAGRLVQGFSLGGEYGAATAFLLEQDPARGRFFASFQAASQYLAALTASAVGWVLGWALPAGPFEADGFRIAFALGAMIGPLGFWLRRTLDESPAFLKAGPAGAPVRTLLRHSWPSVLAGAGAIAVGTGVTYELIYLPTYARTVLGIPLRAGLGSALVSYGLAAVLAPAAAKLLERAPVVPVMAASTVLLMGAVWPLFATLRAHPDVVTMTAVRVVLVALAAPYVVLVPSFLAGLFPAATRVTGLSLGYTLGVTVFGGFAPMLSAWLVARTGNATAPAFYLLASGLITLTSLASVTWGASGVATQGGARGRAPPLPPSRPPKMPGRP